jgi:CO dehydrogenase maturation factor
MKVAVVGKGGVGKTTLASLLARVYAKEGRKVLAIDADPDANLAAAIGLPYERLAEVMPIAAMKELAVERTGHGAGFGGLFKLNPTVDDLPDTLSVQYEGVRILALGSVKHGGSGCFCPEHALLRTLMTHILVRRDDVVIMDMEAGVEHLSRATADAVDVLVIVVEPGQRSLETAKQIERLAADIGLSRIAYVGSKVDGPGDTSFLERSLPPERLLGMLSLNADLRRADIDGRPPFDVGGELLAEVKSIKENLEKYSEK